MSATHQFVESRHGQLAYLVDGEGPPFVLLHGNTMTAESQGRLAQRFSDEYQVFRPDLLGHGKSARPANLFSHDYFTLQGEAIADFLTALFPDQAMPVFGMSAGGIAALNAICLVPERFKALILDSVFIYIGDNTVDAHRNSEQLVSPAWQIYLTKQHGEEWWPVLNESLIETMQKLEQTGQSVAPCLDDIHVPTLIFQGGQDPFGLPIQAQALEVAIRESRLIYEEDAGHILSWRDPAGFREQVRAFLHALER